MGIKFLVDLSSNYPYLNFQVPPNFFWCDLGKYYKDIDFINLNGITLNLNRHDNKPCHICCRRGTCRKTIQVFQRQFKHWLQFNIIIFIWSDFKWSKTWNPRTRPLNIYKACIMEPILAWTQKVKMYYLLMWVIVGYLVAP